MIYKKYLKRLGDIVLSLLALIILFPLLLILYILITIKLGRPAIFKQKRVGLNNKIFTMYKFRSMTNVKNKNNQLLPDHLRLTSFGRKLRATSLDELPELVNIFKGDMSIVGPRPLLVEYLPLYSKEQAKRHNVRPGLTGLAQVSGRNNLSWQEKFDLDIHYINNYSFFTDVKIIFSTIKQVFKKEGITSNTSETVEPFTGNK